MRSMGRGLLLIATLVTVCVHSTGGARILMLPVQAGSHIGYFTALAEGLQEYGHEISMILGDTFPTPNAVKAAKINILTFKTTATWYHDIRQSTKDFTSYIIDHPDDPFGAFNDTSKKLFEDDAEMYVLDEKLFKNVKEKKFDFAIVDGMFVFRHAYLIVELLQLPFVSISGRFEPYIQRIPALPSFVPFVETHLTERMSFYERLQNTFQMILWANMKISEMTLSPKIRTKYADILQGTSVDDIAKRSLLWLIVSDPILDYPRPLLPHVITIGGITVKTPKPLPDDLQKFFDEAKNGVVVVSFGSAVILPYRMIKQMADAFRQLGHLRFLWKLDSVENLDLPEHVKIMKWLPQRDVLAHPNTKVFITHCGNNGQYEAVYSGVPMVGIPIWGDQQYNRNRMVYRGIGIGLETSAVTADKLIHAIRSLIENSSYSEKVKRMAEISRDYSPDTKKRAAFWVDHVIKYGGSHLRSHGIDMPWYQYIMLDIICFIISILTICAYVMLKIIQILCTRIFKTGKKKGKTD